MNITVKYLPAGVEVEDHFRLTDWFCKKKGDVYVLTANTDQKRVLDGYTGSFYGPTTSGVSINFVYREDPLLVVEICIDMGRDHKYSIWAWEYRYGPTLVLVPVIDILCTGEDIPLNIQ